MAVLSEAERREVETLAKALVVLEADRVCVSPIAERCRAAPANVDEGSRPGLGGHESWSGLGQTRECAVDFPCVGEYGGDVGCGGAGKDVQQGDWCGSKTGFLAGRAGVVLATTDLAFRDRFVPLQWALVCMCASG